MSSEPMLNIDEPLPLWLGGLFIIIHLIYTFAPSLIQSEITFWTRLVPMDAPNMPVSRQIVSLLSSGFVHSDWTHVLVNTGMMVAFSVITLRGIRALAHEKRVRNQGVFLSPSWVFLLIFCFGVIGGSLFQWGWWELINAKYQSALGASGGASALFATAAWAMGGRDRLIKFGGGWVILNAVFVIAEPIFGNIAWPAHIGGFVVGAILAPYFVKPLSTGFSITR